MLEIYSKKISDFLTVNLSKKTRIDGRFLLGTLLLIYLLPVIHFFTHEITEKNYQSPWVYPLFNFKMFPPFADMRVITSGWECLRKGYNVLLDNPCDPWGRVMNYPRIWWLFASLGLDSRHTVLLAVIFGSLFFISLFLIIGRINYLESILYALILLSPTVMFAVEKGNNDLIIFSLLSLALGTIGTQKFASTFLSYSIILVAAVLKLHPIFALSVCLKERRKKFLFILFFGLTVFGIYLAVEWKNILLVSLGTPRPMSYAYGGQVLFGIILNYIKLYSNLFQKFPFLYSFLVIGFYGLIFLLLWKIFFEAGKLRPNRMNLDRIDSFRMGASIYLGTFLIGNNYDYRLIFLLFTIPQLLLWAKTRNSFSSNLDISRLSLLGICGIIATVYLSQYQDYFFDEIINWLLFILFAYLFALTLPVNNQKISPQSAD